MITAWNNRDTKRLNQGGPNKTAARTGPLDITTSDNEGKAAKLQELVDKPSTEPSTNVENKE